MKLSTAAGIAAVLAAVLGISCLLHMGLGTTTSGMEQDKMSYTDEKIKELTASEAYQDGSIQQRRALAEELLNQLTEGGYISGVVCDEAGEMFSFQYANGVLGGLMLKEFTTPPGGLPMN